MFVHVCLVKLFGQTLKLGCCQEARVWFVRYDQIGGGGY